jgi:hypothetical protein
MAMSNLFKIKVKYLILKKKNFIFFVFFRQLETLTADWFYKESGRKYKRCGSSKVVQELYKREKQLCKGVSYIRNKIYLIYCSCNR